jgi:hypothetical protein
MHPVASKVGTLRGVKYSRRVERDVQVRVARTNATTAQRIGEGGWVEDSGSRCVGKIAKEERCRPPKSARCQRLPRHLDNNGRSSTQRVLLLVYGGVRAKSCVISKASWSER